MRVPGVSSARKHYKCIFYAVLLVLVMQLFHRPHAAAPKAPEVGRTQPPVHLPQRVAGPPVATTLTTPDASPAREQVVATAAVDDGADGDAFETCYRRTRHQYEGYGEFAERGKKLRETHGPLRMLAFSRLWVPPLHGTGGMQYHALHLYSTLAAQGHTVHVLVTGGPDGRKVLPFDVDPVTLELTAARDPGAARLTVHQVPSAKNGEYSELWFENLLTEARGLNATVGPFHVAHSESWAGVPNAYLLGLPMAVTWHGSMLDWFRNDMNLIVHNFRMKGKMPGDKTIKRMTDLGASVAYETYMLLTVPHHIVISDSAAEDLKSMNLVEPSRVHLIYNGVNPSNFRPDQSARAGFLKKRGITDDPSSLFVVGCGGRLEAIKGHHQLSQAMRLVLQRHSNVVLLVAGHGGESSRYEELKNQGLRVHLLGMMPQTELATFYQSLDCFVDPFYQHHGLNTVMIEATLSGVPLVATRLASAATTVPCEAFGRTFGLGMVDELAAQVEFLYAHPDERRRIGANVRERSLKLFTSHTMAGSYEALLYDAFLNPMPMLPITGKVVCKHVYPAMCYREPS
jgi:glycosyltransferase involved in cell wall biosynthesis